MKHRGPLPLTVALLAIGAFALSGTVAHGEPSTLTCELAGTVTLNAPTPFSEALQEVTTGSFGQILNPASAMDMRCVDDGNNPLSASVTGTFSFCEHWSDNASLRTAPIAQQEGDCGALNTIVHGQDTAGAGLPGPFARPELGGHTTAIADFRGTSTSLTGIPDCGGLSFWGHAAGAQAEIRVRLSCNSSNKNGVGTATSVPVPLVQAPPFCEGSEKGPCFDTVHITGNFRVTA